VTRPSDSRAGDQGLLERAGRAAAVAGEHAQAVDRESRFPSETVSALKKERLLGVQVEHALGGEQASLLDLSRIAYMLGQHCASSAMIFAMHHSQVASLARHWRGSKRDAFLRSVAEEQLLVASSTSEKGGDGSIRWSGCALSEADGKLSLVKQAPVISYGAQASAILATTRRTPTADARDQVLVLLPHGSYNLHQTSEWDALGMRATCSAGFDLSASVDHAFVLDDPFSDVLRRTMLPVAHILWASVWIGIAADAVRRARDHARQAARRGPKGIRSVPNLPKLRAAVGQMEASVMAAVRFYDSIHDPADETELTDLTVEMNSLKVATSQGALNVISDAMVAVGLPAYVNNGSSSLGRHLRDIYSAVAMVHNERICSDLYQLMLISPSRSQLLRPDA
jgi:acyl-CoA dehydrogenase